MRTRTAADRMRVGGSVAERKPEQAPAKREVGHALADVLRGKGDELARAEADDVPVADVLVDGPAGGGAAMKGDPGGSSCRRGAHGTSRCRDRTMLDGWLWARSLRNEHE